MRLLDAMPHDRCKQLFGWVLLGAVVLVGACGGGPPPRLYLLQSTDMLFEDRSEGLQEKRIANIGLSVVTLPGYASDPRIARLVEDGRIIQSDNARWAEDPEDALTRVLAERLRFVTGAVVLVEPWPRGFSPDTRIELSIDRLLQRGDGSAEITGQARLISGDGRSLTGVSDIEATALATDASPAAYMRAVSISINHLADRIVEALIAD